MCFCSNYFCYVFFDGIMRTVEHYGRGACFDALLSAFVRAVIEVKSNGKWISTRIEMGRSWYLVGIKTDDLVGLIVRI